MWNHSPSQSLPTELSGVREEIIMHMKLYAHLYLFYQEPHLLEVFQSFTAELNLKGHNYDGKWKGSKRDYDRIVDFDWNEGFQGWLLRGSCDVKPARWTEVGYQTIQNQGKPRIQLRWLNPEYPQGQRTNSVMLRLPLGLGWGCSSIVEHLPSFQETLGLIPGNATKINNNNNKTKPPVLLEGIRIKARTKATKSFRSNIRINLFLKEKDQNACKK